MQDYDLDKEEQAILEAFENDEFVAVSHPEHEKAKAEAAAKAIEEGIPYQTLASSILHKSTAR